MDAQSEFQPVIHEGDDAQQKSHPDVENHDAPAHLGDFGVSGMRQPK